MDFEMIDKIRFTAIGIIALLLCGCCQDKQKISETANLRKTIENVLRMYIQENPEYDSFLMLTEFSQYPNECRKRIVIGPAYKGLYNSGEGSFKPYPYMFAIVDEKNIFIQSSSDCTVEEKGIREFYMSKEEKAEDKTSAFPIEDYMRHAITFLYDVRKDSIYDISKRADTVMLKKRVEFTPPQVKHD